MEGLESMDDVPFPPGFGPAGMARPPGLAAPPGLDLEQGEEEEATEFRCQVAITGLPNKILSEPMMEAVLQQAGLDSAVVGFTMKSGKPCGEATVTFSCPIAAERCATHFTGCQWDQSGREVQTRIVDLTSKDKQTSKPARKATSWAPSPAEAAAFASGGGLYGEAVHGFDGALACQYMMEMAALSMDSSIFAAPPDEGFPSAALSSALSAEAPAFKPAARMGDGGRLEQVSRRKGSSLGERCVGSDTSTGMGESDGEEDKIAPKIMASAAVL